MSSFSLFLSTKNDDEDYIPAALDYMIYSLAAKQNSPTENMIGTHRKMKMVKVIFSSNTLTRINSDLVLIYKKLIK